MCDENYILDQNIFRSNCDFQRY